MASNVTAGFVKIGVVLCGTLLRGGPTPDVAPPELLGNFLRSPGADSGGAGTWILLGNFLRSPGAVEVARVVLLGNFLRSPGAVCEAVGKDSLGVTQLTLSV